MSRLDLVSCSFALAVAAALVGCGSDDGASGAPLTCDSLTLCSYAEVTTYHTTLAAPAGGAIVDGQYRLAWVETERAEDDGDLEDLEAIEIRDGHYRVSGGPSGHVGELIVDGTDVTLHDTERCSLSATDGATDSSWTYGYTATADQLRLRDTVTSASGDWHVVRVYQRMDGPEELCQLTSSVPSAPGDSAHCWAANCFCAYAANTELAASSCPF